MDPINFSALKVLVIDDETYIRRVVMQLLRRLEVTYIVEAAEGKQGFMEVVRNRPDVVLCDINMKPVDGMTFLSILRKTSNVEIARTPVIFLTADSQQETVIRAAKLHVNGYLVKPVSLTDLKKRITAVLSPPSEAPLEE
ncbi:MAG TPA: response regulator [Azospirillaceae bacterium]|nr:response regulator [Azospirillaceae bacterium]